MDFVPLAFVWGTKSVTVMDYLPLEFVWGTKSITVQDYLPHTTCMGNIFQVMTLKNI
jgi:hypothetical protein